MATVIIVLCAVLLVVYAVRQTVLRAKGKAKNTCCGTGGTVEAKKVADTDESHYPYRYRLDVTGMSCSNCARNVENHINDIGGTWARVDLAKNKATVLSKEVRTESDFADALAGTGYAVAKCEELV